MTVPDLNRLALRILDLCDYERAVLVSLLAQGSWRALEGRPLPHGEVTECLAGACLACQVEEKLAWVWEQ